ncbi:MAG: ABC transporter ATP-binding protein [Lachnospiraceae bacterium]|jgi:oligopeptide transport system ATP-binding protein|nr:ABC transporter ATP-binding protein [Lachnospiraceae bacterium]
METIVENEEKNLLEVEHLRVSFHTYAGEVQAVRDISYTVKPGECLAIVGESGSGKTVSSKAVMGLIEKPQGEIKEGSRITFDGQDVLKFTEKQWEKFRGNDVAMIFQDPMTSLNPTTKVGKQIVEAILLHNKMSHEDAAKRAVELLRMVEIPNPEERFGQYPYEFSGGMRQRVVIAIALACNPRLMIADEPTTALDVTIQAQILRLLRKIQKENNTAIIMITHDLGVVAGMADKIIVMYSGKIMEQGSVRDIFYHPKHPYTRALLKAAPSLKGNGKEELQVIPGTPPDLINPPAGCGFSTRCSLCLKVCKQYPPQSHDFGEGHSCTCWLYHPRTVQVLGEEKINNMLEEQ